MPLSFLESRTGRPWNYDRGGDDFEYYQGQGASQLEIAVADHGERPTKEFLRKTYSDRRGNRMAEDAQKIHQERLILQERLATATQQEIAN